MAKKGFMPAHGKARVWREDYTGGVIATWYRRFSSGNWILVARSFSTSNLQGVACWCFFSGVEKKKRKEYVIINQPARIWTFDIIIMFWLTQKLIVISLSLVVVEPTLILAKSIVESTLLFFKSNTVSEGILSKNCSCFRSFCQTWGATISSSHFEDTVHVLAKYAVVVSPPRTRVYS